jgi:hypothetical protein
MQDVQERPGLIARLPMLFSRAKPLRLPAPEAVPAIAAPVVVSDASPLPDADTATDCFRVRTSQGRFLCLQGDAPAWLESSESLDAVTSVVAVVPAAWRHACLLLSSDGRAFEVHGDPAAGMAASAWVMQTDVPGVVRLKHPLMANKFLVAELGGSLRFDGAGETMQAAFTLMPVPESGLPMGLRSTADEIGRAAASGFRAESLLAALRRGNLRQDLAQAMLRLMPEEELGELARRLMEHPHDRALLRAAVAEDPWITTHLPALAAWRAERAPVAGGITESPAADEALLLPTDSRGVVPLGLALHSLARCQTLPRQMACVVATVKNEGPYLLDWISYHLSIGFAHVFLYANENEDGSDELLELLARHGVITLVRNQRTADIGPQLKGYAHALTMLPQTLDFRWTALLDLDEYLCFDAKLFTDVTDYIGLQECQRVDAIALSWTMHVGLAGDRWSDLATPVRFTRRQRDIHYGVKSLARTRKFWSSHPHFPNASLGAPVEFKGSDGGLHFHPLVPGQGAAVSPRPQAVHAWVNHYMLKSAEEALWKWARGRGDLAASHADSTRPLDFIAGQFLDLARPEQLVEDRRILDCARNQGTVLDGLLKLPGVADCNARINAQFAVKLAKNTKAFLDAPLPADASVVVRAFRELVAEQQKQQGLLS